MANWKKFMGVCCAAVLLGGTMACYLMRPPEDIGIASIRVVDTRDPKLIRDIGQRPFGLFAVVEFSTSKNLARYAREGVYNGVYPDVFLCRIGRSKRGYIAEGFSGIFDKYGLVNDYPDLRQQSGNPPYRFYLNLREGEVKEFNHYDLMQKPEDICFVIVPDFTYVGLWPPSNTVRISREELVNAITRYEKVSFASR